MSAALATRPSDLAGDLLARFHARRSALTETATRDAAAESFARGLPTTRDEAWHYTSLRPLAEAGFADAPAPADAGALARLLPDFAAPRMVFVGGRFCGELSHNENRSWPGSDPAISEPARAPEDKFAPHRDGRVKPGHDLRNDAGLSVRTGPAFGPLARPDSERMVALNTMLTEDGARIDVGEGHDAGALVLAHLGSGSGTFFPRHRIRLAPGSRLTLIEFAGGTGGYLHDVVLEAEVGESATLVHLRVQDESAEGFHISTVYADVAARGTYDSFALTLGARLARMEVHARLGGAGAAAHLNAAQLLGGRQHADFTTVVSHDAPSCASRQTVKNVLTGRSRGVFQGRIQVARAAQKTDGYQMNQALLLSPHAEIDSKPQLQIYADDVKCSHGCTVGELSADQLFYLRSRGIPDAEARAILVRAFLTEALDPIAHAPTRAVMESMIDGWRARHAA